MKTLKFLNLGFSTLLLGLISTPVMAASITIDRFTDADPEYSGYQFAIDDTPDGNSVISTDGETEPLDEVIGGIRTIEVNKISGPLSLPFNPNANAAQLTVNTNDGFNSASFSTPSSTKGSFSFLYDGDGFGSGIDLTDGEINDSFVINTLSNDLGVTLNFEVSDGINTATLSKSLSAGQTGTTYFPFADFSDPTLLTQATSIRMYSSDEPTSLDFEFQNFQSTQEVPFGFSPILGIIIHGSLFGIRKIKKKLSNSIF